MASLLGIDIGTSGTKVMLLDEKTGVAGIESETYQVSIPRLGYAEQNPVGGRALLPFAPEGKIR